MLIKNLNPLFQIPHIEGKYLSILGMIGAVFYMTVQHNLSIYLKMPIVAIFPIIAFAVHRRMIKELRGEPKLRKDYLVFIKVRFWSFVTLIVFFMLFVIGLELI